jgi:choline-glycine betaine transporter
VSAIAIMLFTFFTLSFQNDIEPIFLGPRNGLTGHLDRFFLAAGTIFVLVCLGLVMSRWAVCAWEGQRPSPITAMWVGFQCRLPPAWALV